MSKSTIDLFEGFAEAVAALKAKPELEAQILHLQAQLDAAQRLADNQRSAIESLQLNVASSSDRIRSLEVERDSYFLEAEEAKESMSKVASVLGLVKPQPPAPVEEIPATPAPLPEPVSTLVDPAPVTPRPFDSAMTTSPVESHTSPATEEPSATPSPLPVWPVSPQASPSDTASPQPSASAEPEAQPPVRYGFDPLPETAPEPASSNFPPSSPATSVDALSGDEASSPDPFNNNSKPYLGQRTDQKPHWMSWTNWVNGGGEKPHWWRE